MTNEEWRARLSGNAFDDEDVVRCYACRPPYAQALHDFLLTLVPQRRCLVDLGCGPGKVAGALSRDFAETIAIDPSAAMIAEGRRLYSSTSIKWICAGAEDAALPDRIDLVTAGTAIHWMKHEVLFPKLAQRTELIAVLSIKAPRESAWAVAQDALMTRWLARIGETYDPIAFDAKNRLFERWLDIGGQSQFTTRFSQSIADFVTGMHSTAVHSRSRMGADLAAEFDRELEAMLAPHETNGTISFDVTSELTWGAPRRTARA